MAHQQDRAHSLEQRLEHINPIKAQLLKILGPADGWDDPLVGTQYDPVVRQKIETEQPVTARIPFFLVFAPPLGHGRAALINPSVREGNSK